MKTRRVAKKGYHIDILLSKVNDRKVARELKELMEIDEKEFCEKGLLYYINMLLDNEELIIEKRVARLKELFGS